MIIPTLNPLRFVKEKNNYLLENNLFSDFTAKQGDRKQYKPQFVDFCKNIYYKPFLSGTYGFDESDINLFINNSGATNLTEVINSVVKIGDATGTNPYPLTYNLGDALDPQKIIIKGYGSTTLRIISDSGVLLTLSTMLNGIYSYTLASETNVYIEINGGGTLATEIHGIVLAEDVDNYDLCNTTKQSEIIDLSPKGTVYELSTTDKTNFLADVPLGNIASDYNDTITAQTVTFRNDWQEYPLATFIRLVFDNGYSSDIPRNGDVMNTISNGYGWHSVTWDASNEVLALHSAFTFLESIQFRDFNGEVYTPLDVTVYDTYKDIDFWYFADGMDVSTTNIVDSIIHVTKVINAQNYSISSVLDDSNGGNLIINSDTSFDLKITDLTTLQFGSSNDEILKVKKVSDISFYGCCQFTIGDYISEIFEVIEEQENLTKIEFSDTEFSQGMAFDNFTGVIYLDLIEEINQGNEVDVFIEQERNTNLGQNIGQFKKLSTSNLIPNYLVEQLSNTFNFDTIKINDRDFNIKQDGTQFEKVGMYLYKFSVELRKSNYNYEV